MREVVKGVGGHPLCRPLLKEKRENVAPLIPLDPTAFDANNHCVLLEQLPELEIGGITL